MNGNEGSTPRDFSPDDAPDLSRNGWPEKFAKATVRRGRPLAAKPKVSTTIRLSQEVIDHFKSDGRGWQTRIDEALREWIAKCDGTQEPDAIHAILNSWMKDQQMEIQKDSKGQPYIEWSQAEEMYKRAWVQCRTGRKDWAGSGRYLNVVRCASPGRIGGNPTDFPIYNDLPAAEILVSFVYAVNAVTGYTKKFRR